MFAETYSVKGGFFKKSFGEGTVRQPKSFVETRTNEIDDKPQTFP